MNYAKNAIPPRPRGYVSPKTCYVHNVICLFIHRWHNLRVYVLLINCFGEAQRQQRQDHHCETQQKTRRQLAEWLVTLWHSLGCIHPYLWRYWITISINIYNICTRICSNMFWILSKVLKHRFMGGQILCFLGSSSLDKIWCKDQKVPTGNHQRTSDLEQTNPNVTSDESWLEDWTSTPKQQNGP